MVMTMVEVVVIMNRFPIESQSFLRDEHHSEFILKVVKEQVNAGQVNAKVVACLPVVLWIMEGCEWREEVWLNGWSVIEQIILPSPRVGSE